jgi:hypothetical protein
MSERVKEIAVILGKGCPHCQQLFKESRVFNSFSKRIITHIYDIQDEVLLHEASALYVGITEKERLLWATGQQRGTVKTPTFVEVDLTTGSIRADIGPQGEFELWLLLNTMLSEMNEPRLPPPSVEKEKTKRKKKRSEEK